MNRLVVRSLRQISLRPKSFFVSQQQQNYALIFRRALSDAKSAVDNNSATNPQKKVEENVEAPKEGQSTDKNVMKIDFDEYDDYYEPQTPKEKFKAYGTFALRISLVMLGAFCVYLTAKELFPGRMNPNSLFSEVFDKLRYHEQVMEIIGEEARAFGRDVGRNTEGRRNHVDSFKYKAEDGKERMRIRMNIKGTNGQVRVWAEVQEGSNTDEFVYLILQNTSNGRVLTLVDRRDELEAGIGSTSGDDSIAKLFSLKK